MLPRTLRPSERKVKSGRIAAMIGAAERFGGIAFDRPSETSRAGVPEGPERESDNDSVSVQ
jgi:hypothetical protein